MTTAVIVYRSLTGTTRRYADAIGAELRSHGIEVRVESVAACEPEALADADLVLLGCWTKGHLVVGQQPDAAWIAFARSLTDLGRARVGLFATFKIATGPMFRRMRSVLEPAHGAVSLELASRSGRLSDADRRSLAAWCRGARTAAEDRPAQATPATTRTRGEAA